MVTDEDRDEADKAADELDRLTAEVERLHRLTDDMASHWLDLQDKHPISCEGGLDGAMRAACAEIERLRLGSTHTCHDQCQREVCVLRRERDAMAIENSRLRAKLELTPENVERMARAMQSEGERNDPLEHWETELATAAIKAMGDE